eukprot:TRINITY_DN11256_c0_g1_i1.p1 TRINITY_DN11256_c0_g1~~TRINITY_DN11256_c0_g1_i1.p1  ORF type:complete len:385 (-),score=76.28 TRINITY_DN11256_c0_g1_i1:221-1375(-)
MIKDRFLIVGTNGHVLKFDVNSQTIIEKWRKKVEGCGLFTNFNCVHTDQSYIYCGIEGHVSKMNIEDGQTLWTKKTDKLSSIFASCNMYLKVVGELVVCHGKGAVAALNKNTGDILWETGISGQQNVSSVVVGNILYVGSAGFVYAISLENGQKIWENSLKGMLYNGVTLSYQNRGFGTALLCGTHGHIVVLEPSTGTSLKEINLKGTGYNPVSIISTETRIYVGTHGEVIALDPISYDVIWMNDLPGLGYSYGFALLNYTTSISREEVVFVGFRGYVVCLSASNGTLLWKLSLESAGYFFVSLVLVDNVLYAGSGGYLYIINADTGVQIAREDLKGLGLNLIHLSGSQHNIDENSQNILTCLEERQRQQAAQGGAAGASVAMF